MNIRSIAARPLTILSALLILGCSDSDDPTATQVATVVPNARRDLGVIAGYGTNDPQISLRAEGRMVEVTIITYGNGCYSAAYTHVEMNGQDALLAPYDWNPGCPQRDLKSVVHVVSVRFAQPGVASIRVRGIDAHTRSSRNMLGDTVTVARSVVLK